MTTTEERIAVQRRLPPELGERQPSAHVYRRFGRRADFPRWFDLVCEVCEPEGVLSPGAVGLYVGVTRAAVHKRLKEGRLTAFQFYVVETGTARQPERDLGRPYTYVPLAECRAWAQVLKRRPDADACRPGAEDDSWRQW